MDSIKRNTMLLDINGIFSIVVFNLYSALIVYTINAEMAIYLSQKLIKFIAPSPSPQTLPVSVDATRLPL
jgi:hypothetical protein